MNHTPIHGRRTHEPRWLGARSMLLVLAAFLFTVIGCGGSDGTSPGDGGSQDGGMDSGEDVAPDSLIGPDAAPDATPDADNPDVLDPDASDPDASDAPDSPVSQCQSGTCNHHGTCTDTPAGPQCTCDEGWAAPDCVSATALPATMTTEQAAA